MTSLPSGMRVECLRSSSQQDLIGCGALRALDVHFGLDDRHKPVASTCFADLELLGDDRGDARRVGEIDDRTLLGSEHARAHFARSAGRRAPASASSAERRSPRPPVPCRS